LDAVDAVVLRTRLIHSYPKLQSIHGLRKTFDLLELHVVGELEIRGIRVKCRYRNLNLMELVVAVTSRT
jgi:hypothetical protein